MENRSTRGKTSRRRETEKAIIHRALKSESNSEDTSGECSYQCAKPQCSWCLLVIFLIINYGKTQFRPPQHKLNLFSLLKKKKENHNHCKTHTRLYTFYFSSMKSRLYCMCIACTSKRRMILNFFLYVRFQFSRQNQHSQRWQNCFFFFFLSFDKF